jgi:hypothetical protein
MQWNIKLFSLASTTLRVFSFNTPEVVPHVHPLIFPNLELLRVTIELRKNSHQRDYIDKLMTAVLRIRQHNPTLPHLQLHGMTNTSGVRKALRKLSSALPPRSVDTANRVPLFRRLSFTLAFWDDDCMIDKYFLNFIMDVGREVVLNIIYTDHSSILRDLANFLNQEFALPENALNSIRVNVLMQPNRLHGFTKPPTLLPNVQWHVLRPEC